MTIVRFIPVLFLSTVFSLVPIAANANTDAGAQQVVAGLLKSIDIPDVGVEDVELYPQPKEGAFFKMTGDNPVTGAKVIYQSADKLFTIDTSYYSKSTSVIFGTGYPVDEYMHILEGQVEIIDSDGTSNTYGPGDAFFFPKGWTGTWNQLTADLKKIAIIYGPYIFDPDYKFE